MIETILSAISVLCLYKAIVFLYENLMLSAFFRRWKNESLRLMNLDSEIYSLKRRISSMETVGLEAEDKRVYTTHISVSGDKHLVKYKLNGKHYSALLRSSASDGTDPKFHITDRDRTVVTDHVLKFMGPNFDFNNIKLKVKELGYDCLIFHMLGQKPLIFEADEFLPTNLSNGFNWDKRRQCLPPCTPAPHVPVPDTPDTPPVPDTPVPDTPVPPASVTKALIEASVE
ncbi:hypothetical protein IIV31_002L [Armadillidium vulgare iridescent virus]|uniref:Uncharacterized protein n=1 Tax=Armadillidium vulgare iridescent virus TaxID=72201 RepID=A0A068QLN2_9VIRU|nr:hypothetical protein IIV31_002L [Armadillidium vulgare iridescent virus]CCV02374.1 hypothetical protein IIV31_002L [Armadillidium vulgare iridescent virus]